MKNENRKTLHQNIKYHSDDFKIVSSGGIISHQERAFHEAIEIKLFYEGRSMIMIDSDVIVAEVGDITVANPYEIHANIVNDAYSGKCYSLIVDLDFFSDTGIGDIDLRHLILAKHHRFNHIIRNNRRMGEIIMRIREEMQDKKEYYRTIVANLIAELFALLLREEASRETPVEKKQDYTRRGDVISAALQKIFSDYSRPITVDELSELCNISKYHFCRVFKQHMGVTVTQYIVNYRISLADSMLKNENLSIKSIAETCGFGDVSYFYQCYKRIKGCSPGKARKQEE